MAGWPRAESIRQAGHLVTWEMQEPAPLLTSGAEGAAFISSTISLAITGEDRLADVNINTSPSCLTSVP